MADDNNKICQNLLYSYCFPSVTLNSLYLLIRLTLSWELLIITIIGESMEAKRITITLTILHSCMQAVWLKACTLSFFLCFFHLYLFLFFAFAFKIFF